MMRAGGKTRRILLAVAPLLAIAGAVGLGGSIDQMLTTPAFVDRFSRFVNATFNSGPGALQTDDAVYFLTKYVLTNAKPWTDLFIGKYDVDVDASSNMVVTADPNGLGYFRSIPWQRR